MYDAVAVHHVEMIVGERQALAVSVVKLTTQATQLKITLRLLQMTTRQIEIRDHRPAFCELREIGAQSCSDLQHPAPRMLVELHHFVHPWRVLRIPVSLDLQIPIQGSFSRGLRILRPARVPVPLTLNFVFICVTGVKHCSSPV